MAVVAPGQKRIVLSTLLPEEQDRILNFLVANKVDFKAGPSGSDEYHATVRLEKAAARKKNGSRPEAKEPKEPKEPKQEARTPSKNNASATAEGVNQSSNTKRREKVHGEDKADKNDPADPITPDLKGSVRSAMLTLYTELSKKYKSLCSMLPRQDAQPKLMLKRELMKFIDDVYNMKYQADTMALHREALRSEMSVMLANIPDSELRSPPDSPQTDLGARGCDWQHSFPSHVIEFTRKKHGMRSLVVPILWNLVYTLEHYRDSDAHVGVFANFVDETYDGTSVLFYLHSRHMAMRLTHALTHRASAYPNKDANHVQSKADRCRNSKATLVGENVYGACLNKSQAAMLVTNVLGAQEELQAKISKKMKRAFRLRARTDTPPFDQREALTIEIRELLSVMVAQFHETFGARVVAPPKISLCPPLQSLCAARMDEALTHHSDPKKHALAEKQTAPSGNEDLEEVIKRSASEVAHQVMNNMHRMGKDVAYEDVKQWAYQVAKRNWAGGKPPESGGSLGQGAYTTSPTEMCQVWKDLDSPRVAGEWETRKVSVFLSGAGPRPPPSASDFANDLEGSIHTILFVATAEMVGEVFQNDGLDLDTFETIYARLCEEVRATADALMEALVSEKYDAWLMHLKIAPPGDKNQKQEFDLLYAQLQEVLADEIQAASVAKLCTAILSNETLRGAVELRATQLLTDPDSFADAQDPPSPLSMDLDEFDGGDGESEKLEEEAAADAEDGGENT